MNEDREYLPYSREGTSQAAAESQRGKSKIMREQVYDYIEATTDGATVDEITEATGIYRYWVVAGTATQSPEPEIQTRLL